MPLIAFALALFALLAIASLMPEGSSTTLRADLSEVAIEYSADLATKGFIGRRVLPQKKVAEKASSYPVLRRASLMGVEDTRRASNGSYNQVHGNFGTLNYECEEHGLEYPLDVAKAKQYATWLDFEQAGTTIAMHKILLAEEKRCADLVFATGTYTFTAVSTAWSTAATATPLYDLKTASRTIAKKTGIPAAFHTAIMNQTEFDYLCATTEVKNQVLYTYARNGGVRPFNLTADIIAEILGIKQVLVGMAAYNTAVEGETISESYLWPDGYAMIAILADDDAPLEMPSAFRQMLWTEDSPINPVVERYYSNSRRANIVRVRHNVDEVLTATQDLLFYGIDTAP